MKLRLLIPSSIFGLCACGSPMAPTAAVPDGYEDCTTGGAFAFSVRVMDARTSETLVEGTTAEWTAGLSRGTLSPNPPKFPDSAGGDSFTGPYGRPGRFAIVITRPGYGTWQGSILVGQGAQHCDVLPAGVFTALLEPK